MDPTTCPSTTTTDTAFKPNDYSCDTEIVVFWLVNIVLLTSGIISRWLRFIRTYPIQKKTWIDITREVNFILTIILSIIIVICIGANKATYTNGVSFSLVNLHFLSCTAEIQFSWRGKVKRKAMLFGSGGGGTGRQQVGSLSLLGKIFLTCSSICVLVSAVVMIFISPIDRDSYSPVIGWYSNCGYFLFLMLGVSDQLFRTAKSIQVIFNQERDPTKSYVLSRALIQLRMEFLMFSVFPLLSIIVYALMASHAVIWSWHFILSPIYFDLIGSLVYESLQRMARHGNHRMKKMIQMNNNNNDVMVGIPSPVAPKSSSRSEHRIAAVAADDRSSNNQNNNKTSLEGGGGGGSNNNTPRNSGG
jgi:hypothetical protein